MKQGRTHTAQYPWVSYGYRLIDGKLELYREYIYPEACTTVVDRGNTDHNP